MAHLILQLGTALATTLADATAPASARYPLARAGLPGRDLDLRRPSGIVRIRPRRGRQQPATQEAAG
jgi:hypothetical protein